MAAQLGKIGVWTSLWQWPKVPDEVRTAATTLDELGYGTVWMGTAVGDLALAEAVLDATNRLTVATGILDVWTSPASVVATSHHRVTTAHPDRFVLGLGSSHAVFIEAVTEETYTRPLSRLRGFLDELDVADPPVPAGERVLAALGPRALALAGERSAGAHPYLVTPEHTESARQLLGDGPLLAPEQKVVVSTDPAEARRVARRSLAIYLSLPNYLNNLRRLGFDDDDFSDGGSDHLVDSLVAWGDLATVKQRIDAHLAAGADHVAVQVLWGGEAAALPLPAWKEFAAILPSYT